MMKGYRVEGGGGFFHFVCVTVQFCCYKVSVSVLVLLMLLVCVFFLQ